MNRLVMDYLVVEGYRSAAENFCKESGVEAVDLKAIEQRTTIRNAIQRGDIEEAIEQINDLNSEVSLPFLPSTLLSSLLATDDD